MIGQLLESNLGRVFGTLLVIGIAGSTVSYGTFATFTAQTTNPGNTFATGTLVLSNRVGTGTACLSTGGGNTDTNTNNCDTAFSLSVRKPGDTSTATLDLKNEGSLAGAALKVFIPSCTAGNATGQNYHGTGNPCQKLQIYIQKWTDSTRATPAACLYGGATGNTCNFSDTTKTVATFVTAHNSATSGLSGGAIAAGETQYYTIGLKLIDSGPGADNALQGRQATFDLSWFMEQA
jgi:hypothetical protein